MLIVETPVFTKQITTLLSDESYAQFQELIRINPEVGDLIPGSGGLRKVRWKAQDRGKRGGIRVIYYWYSPQQQVYLLLAYAKNQQDNLSAKQLKILKQLVQQEFNDG